MQMPEGHGGFLIESNEECAARIVELLNDPMEAQELGTKGRAHTKENFLITRMIAEELRLLNSL